MQTHVWQHGSFQAVSKSGHDIMELQQGVETLILGCPLHGCAQAHRNRWHHRPQSLDQQHCHHLIWVSEHLLGCYRLGTVPTKTVSHYIKCITEGQTIISISSL